MHEEIVTTCDPHRQERQALPAARTNFHSSRPSVRHRLPLLVALVGLLSLSAALLPATPVTATDEGEGSSAVLRGERWGNTSNLVFVHNRTDNKARLRASLELARVPGETVHSANIAFARASCTDCQTFAVALQIVLYKKNASTVAPQNAAVAYNENCLRCYTVARAIQYAVPVDDPTQPPENVKALLRDMERELRDATKGDFTVEQVEARINDVIARFKVLAESLYETRDEQQN